VYACHGCRGSSRIMTTFATGPALPLVFLLDVDDTLLDNDAVIEDLRHHLIDKFGPECQSEYWRHFEELRRELGYADYLGALQRYRVDHPRDPQVIGVSLFLLHYPFAKRLYPRALEAVAELRRRAPAIILTDGDAVFQPHKVERSGLWAAVGGEVLIYIHKEQVLDDVEQRYPARHYVMVDDKLRILTAMKGIWGDRLTTVFVRQGHYAMDPEVLDLYPAADVTLDRIGDLIDRVPFFNQPVPAAPDVRPAPGS
jgi:FMN phosphatase YigB (HAD superfamily)